MSTLYHALSVEFGRKGIKGTHIFEYIDGKPGGNLKPIPEKEILYLAAVYIADRGR